MYFHVGSSILLEFLGLITIKPIVESRRKARHIFVVGFDVFVKRIAGDDKTIEYTLTNSRAIECNSTVFMWLVSSVQDLFKSNMKVCKVQRGKAGTVKYLTNYDITHNSSML